jgi:hypothetical protein
MLRELRVGSQQDGPAPGAPERLKTAKDLAAKQGLKTLAKVAAEVGVTVRSMLHALPRCIRVLFLVRL